MPRISDPDREAYLDLHARCNQAFTPFAPVQLPDFFAGRLEVVRRVSAELSAPGRQVAIFGERGVGKTSLAELLSFFTHFDPEKAEIYRCGRDDNFDSIFFHFAHRFGGGLHLDTVEKEGGRKLGVNLGSLAAGGERRSRQVYRASPQATSTLKNRVLELFADADALLIIDEYDRILDARTHTRLAELVKAFSDSRSSSRIVIVGVADTVVDLIGEHTSLSRSLAQIKLERMSDAELVDIIRRGEHRTALRFRDPVAHRIVRLADGFPHYVHLISLHAALAAIKPLLDGMPQHRLEVGDSEYAEGVREAITNSEHTLTHAYEDAIVTTRRHSDVYELILQAIAIGEKPISQVRDIARHASTLAGRELSPAQLSTALGRLTRPEKGEVLHKVRDGFYKYRNPLMRAYVRLLLDDRYRGQLKLPFFDA